MVCYIANVTLVKLTLETCKYLKAHGATMYIHYLWSVCVCVCVCTRARAWIPSAHTELIDNNIISRVNNMEILSTLLTLDYILN